MSLAAQRPTGKLMGSELRLPLAMGVLLLGAAISLWPLAQLLHRQWTGVVTYNHGYVLLALAAWLVWRRCRSLPAADLSPDWRWLLPLLAVIGALVLMELLFLNVPRTWLLPPLLVSLVGLTFGSMAGLAFLGPGLFLYLAVPLWLPLQAPLQALTTAIVSRVLASTGIPAYIEGNFVYLPAGTFEIATDCSGLNYLLVGMTLSLFYGLAFLRLGRHRLLLFATAVILTLVCNWLRVYTIILAGHLTDMQHYLVAVDHELFGWVLFGVFLLPVLWLARRLQDHPAELAHEGEEVGARRHVVASRVLWAAFLGVALLFLPRALTLALNVQSAQAVDEVPAIAGTGYRAEISGMWEPVFSGAIDQQLAFDGPDGPLEVYRAVYPWQTGSQRLVRYGQTFTGRGWRPIATRTLEVEWQGQPVTITEFDGYHGQQRSLIAAWYIVSGHLAVGDTEAKLQELRGLLAGRRDAQAIAVMAECGVDCGAARERIRAFVSAHADELAWQP